MNATTVVALICSRRMMALEPQVHASMFFLFWAGAGLFDSLIDIIPERLPVFIGDDSSLERVTIRNVMYSCTASTFKPHYFDLHDFQTALQAAARANRLESGHPYLRSALIDHKSYRLLYFAQLQVPQAGICMDL